MSATAYVASYAALVATASTGVRIRSSVGRRALRIECLLRHGWIYDKYFGVVIPGLYVTAINRSSFPVVWDAVELAAEDDADPNLRLHKPARMRVEPRDSASVVFARHRLPDGFPYASLPEELDRLTKLWVTLLLANGQSRTFVQKVRPTPEPLEKHRLSHTWT